jgi:hypothetical protein
MDGWIDGWMCGRMEGWVDGWISGWMDGWNERCWLGRCYICGALWQDRAKTATGSYPTVCAT